MDAKNKAYKKLKNKFLIKDVNSLEELSIIDKGYVNMDR